MNYYNLLIELFESLSGLIPRRLRRNRHRERSEAIQCHKDKFWIASPPLAVRNDAIPHGLRRYCSLESRIARIIQKRVGLLLAARFHFDPEILAIAALDEK